MRILDRWRWWWLPLVFGLGLAGGYLGAQSGALGDTEHGGDPLTQRRTTAVSEQDGANHLAEIDPSSHLATLVRIAAVGRDEIESLCDQLLVADGEGRHLWALMDRWVELDPQGGFEYFLNGGAARIQSFGTAHYCRRWALVDPDQSLRAAHGIEDPGELRFAIGRVSIVLAAERPSDYFRIYFDGAEGSLSSTSRTTAVRSLALSDPAAAVAILGKMEAAERNELAADVASGWAKSHPDAALEWVRQLDDDDGRMRGIEAIASRLLTSDGDRAGALYKECAEWRAAMESDENRQIRQGRPGSRPFHFNDYVWSEATGVLSETDPEAAIAWVAKHFPDKAGDLVGDYLPADGVAAVEMLATLPEYLLRDGRLPGQPGDGWRPAQIEVAIDRLSEIANPVTRESAHAWLLGVQAETDPKAAITSAIANLSDPAERARVLQNGMGNWATQDLTGASEWLATRPAGEETDGAIIGLIKVAQYLEPSSALAWAQEIGDSGVRRSGFTMLYSAWERTDETAARAAFGTIDLSDEERNELEEWGVEFPK